MNRDFVWAAAKQRYFWSHHTGKQPHCSSQYVQRLDGSVNVPAQVFAPLARLLGMYSIKEELEDLAFSYADPEAYRTIRGAVEALARAQQMPAVKEVRPLFSLALYPGSGIWKRDAVSSIARKEEKQREQRKREEERGE